MEWRREKPTLIKHLFDILEPDDIPHVFVCVCMSVCVCATKQEDILAPDISRVHKTNLWLKGLWFGVVVHVMEQKRYFLEREMG